MPQPDYQDDLAFPPKTNSTPCHCEEQSSAAIQSNTICSDEFPNCKGCPMEGKELDCHEILNIIKERNQLENALLNANSQVEYLRDKYIHRTSKGENL